MTRPIHHLTLPLVCVLVCSVGAAACGGDDTTATATSSSSSTGGGNAGGASSSSSGGGQGPGGGGHGGTGPGGSSAGGGVPGGLDPTFGDGGIALVNTGDADDYISGAARQSTGKLVLAGTTSAVGESQVLLLRLATDGQLDTSFGAEGKVLTPIRVSATATGIAVQPDDKIVVAARASAQGSFTYALARYGADGSLDPSFGGGDGLVAEDAGTAGAVALQPDGKIVVAGIFQQAPAVLRHLPDGSLDASFGAGGVAPPAANVSGAQVGRAVEIQPDGKIVVVFGGPGGGFVSRLTPTGALDPSFDGDGTVDLSETPQALALQQDGKLVVAGGLSPGELRRLLPSGAVDNTFGMGTGVVEIGDGALYDVIVDPNGALVVGGDFDIGGNGSLARVTPDGTLDPTFGGDGIAEDLLGMAQARVRAVVPRGDGTYLAAGVGVSGTVSAAAAAVLAGGSPDVSFGSGGVALHNSKAAVDALTRIALAPDGSVTLLARRRLNCLARLDPSGTLDAGFGTGGIANKFYSQQDLLSTPGGGLLAAVAGPFGFQVVRYGPTGAADPSFGSGGTASLFGGANAGPFALAVDDTDRVLAAGYLRDASNDDRLVVARFSSTGSPDTGFDGDGVAAAPPGLQAGIGTAIARQPDGKLLVATYPFAYLSPTAPSLLLRFEDDGAVDATFGVAGVVELDLETFPRRIAALEGGGALVAARERDCSGPSPCVHHLALMKLDASGGVDPSFGTGGVFRELLTGFDPWPALAAFDPQPLVVYPDGRILVGDAVRTGDRDQILLIRLSATGQLDPTFGVDGRLTLPELPGNWRVADATLQPDGKLLLGGVGFSPATGSDLAVLRLLP